jgi:hypothetical protein
MGSAAPPSQSFRVLDVSGLTFQGGVVVVTGVFPTENLAGSGPARVRRSRDLAATVHCVSFVWYFVRLCLGLDWWKRLS